MGRAKTQVFVLRAPFRAHPRLLVAQHYPSSYLAATLQIAQRRARLVRGTRLNRDRRDLASLDESEKLPQILDRADVRALDCHHLEREQHCRDRARSTVKLDHDELATLPYDIDATLHRLDLTDDVYRRSGATVSLIHNLFHYI